LNVDSVFTIREATRADSTSIAELISELGYPTSESDMRARLAAIEPDTNYRTFVAQIAATVAIQVTIASTLTGFTNRLAMPRLDFGLSKNSSLLKALIDRDMLVEIEADAAIP
jgi:hypothetical protein